MTLGSSSNSYEILLKLAEGGMAELFLARNTTGAGVQRIVVLKRILPEHANDSDLVRMFVHEARLAAQLQHANVAQVYDVGKLGASYFFTMEYVHGHTVRDVMLHARQQHLELPLDAVLAIAAGAAAGLHHAHERRGIDGRPLGIVHSDVSPTNLIISREGVVKLLDFGIARASGSTTNTDGTLRGKIAYLSPEQCHSSQQIDRRSDLFSLGIVLWEMLTLRGLYRRRSDYETMMAIESESPTPPSLERDDVPQVIDEIVLRLLAKDPAQRFHNAQELSEAIERAAIRLGCALSPTSLARLTREWFGDKPEPWLRGSTKQQLIVAAEPVSENFVKTLRGPVDDLLHTLPPYTPRPADLFGEPPRNTPGKESLEQMRDRLFREAKARKSPAPNEALGEPAPGAHAPLVPGAANAQRAPSPPLAEPPTRGSNPSYPPHAAANPRAASPHPHDANAAYPRAASPHPHDANAAYPRAASPHPPDANAAYPRAASPHPHDANAYPRAASPHPHDANAAYPRAASPHPHDTNAAYPRAASPHPHDANAAYVRHGSNPAQRAASPSYPPHGSDPSQRAASPPYPPHGNPPQPSHAAASPHHLAPVPTRGRSMPPAPTQRTRWLIVILVAVVLGAAGVALALTLS